VRRHAKAATAGSTMRRARGLGRFFRGVGAGHVASLSVEGSGASSRRGRLLVLAIAFAIAVVCLAAALASAASVSFEFQRSFGPDGTDTSGFTSDGAGSIAIDHGEGVAYVLDRGADALFKFDLEGNPVNFGGSNPDVSGNELSGLEIGGVRGSRQVAVDSNTHIVYLTAKEISERSTAIQAFTSNGDPSLFTAGPGAGKNEIDGFYELRGVAVDSNGNIYVAGVDEGVVGNNINVYKPSGELLLKRVGESISAPTNLAVDTNGTIYVLRNAAEVMRYVPSEYPITPATTYPSSPDMVDPKFAVSLTVDPSTNRLYVTEHFFEESVQIDRVAIFGEDGTPEGTFAGPGEPGELEYPDGIAVGTVEEPGIEGGIAQPLVANNPEGGLSQVEIFKEELVITAPSIELTAVNSVTGDSALLRGKVNPNNRETTYWFEYGSEDCEASACTKIPLAGEPIGHGRKGIRVSQPINGLQAQSTYHYRVVAENELETTEGPDRTFTTQGSGLGFALIDSRVWEMVSPPKKFGGTLVNTGITTIQASAAGDKLAYASRGPIVEKPVSNRLVDFATVLAKRGGGGEWASEDLTPAHTEASKVEFVTPFSLFTPDLLRAELEPTGDTPLSSEASEQTPYLWSDGSPPLFTPMVNPSNVPLGTEFGPKASGSNDPIRIEGASKDLEHVVIRSDEVPLVEGAAVKSIYRWSNGELEAISQLPEGEGGEIVLGMLGAGQGSVRHAISSDGSRVFWTPSEGYRADGLIPSLYLRDTVGKESTRLDVVQSGASGAGLNRPVFNIASADGHVVFFTDSQQLTEDASPEGRDLYRCEIGTVEGGLGCAELTDISGQTASPGESAEVLDQVSAASEDGTRLYFVARGVLDEVPNESGDVAQSGAPNLYLWQEGQGVRFIAPLSEADYLVWGEIPGNLGYAERISAAASPNGRYLAFTSEDSLTGNENLNESEEPVSEAFLYDAVTGKLACVSCNPSGAAAVGERIPNTFSPPQDPSGLWWDRWTAATLPEASRTRGVVGRSLYHPRTVMDSGRVFFNAVDPLVPADSNGAWDVYQWEPLGVGSCTASTSTASTVRSGEGCVGLLSSGTAEGDSGFLDASASGNDVFFLTRGQLSVTDFDQELDAYDARVNGAPATLTPSTECLGEACQPAANAPNDPTPASAAFKGEGNVKPTPNKRCAKGKRKVRRGGKARCVARKQHKRAGKSGRAGR